MFRSHSAARRLCLGLLLLAGTALCLPPAPSSAATLSGSACHAPVASFGAAAGQPGSALLG